MDEQGREVTGGQPRRGTIPSPGTPGTPVQPVPLALGRELVRKSLHLSSAVAPVAYATMLSRDALLPLLGMLLLLAVIVELARRRVSWVRRLFERAAGPLLREHELTGVSGATWLLVAFTGVVALAPAPAAIVAMWSVSVGDAAAAVVGRSYSAWMEARGRGAGAGRKTLVGSAACVLATFVGAVWVAGLPPTVALVAGVAAAIAEWPRAPLDDNVRVAMVVAVVVTVVVTVTGVM